MSRNRLARRNVSTTILMTSSAFCMSTIDRDTGEAIDIPLLNTLPAEKEQLAKTLCELHGIGSRKQWSKYHEQKKAEAAERKAKWKERRAAKQEEKRPTPTLAHREATVERRPMHTAMA